MHSSRADLVAGAEAIDAHLKLSGLFMHVGRGKKRSKTEAVLFHKHNSRQEDGIKSDVALACGKTISFTPQFTYLGSMIHCSLSDSHDVANRIRKASAAFEALQETIFGPSTCRFKRKRRSTRQGFSACCFTDSGRGT